MPSDTIATELARLAAFYGCDDAWRRAVAVLDLDHYVEIVLDPGGCAVVTGGVGREEALIAEARALACPAEVVAAFRQCAARFPHKMAYAKVALGPRTEPPTLYLGLIEPWESVAPFLRTLPGLDAGIAALTPHTEARPICYMLAFSMQADALVVKTYQLAPRAADGPPDAPFLISYRLQAGATQLGKKVYTAGISWDDLPADGRWPAIAAVGRALFGDTFALVRSEDMRAHRGKGVKLYVFRYDKRESATYSLKTFNYYADEGVRLYQLGHMEAAIASLTDAIRFGRGDQAQVYNMRGLVQYGRRHFEPALADFDAALRLDAMLAQAHNNRAAALLQLGNYEAAVYAAGHALFLNPAGDPTNLDMAKRLLRLSQLVS